jgi:hypothetical protein
MCFRAYAALPDLRGEALLRLLEQALHALRLHHQRDIRRAAACGHVPEQQHRFVDDRATEVHVGTRNYERVEARGHLPDDGDGRALPRKDIALATELLRKHYLRTILA